MATVVISPSNVATYPEGGGHFWVHMQYVQGLLELGCDVYWLERLRRTDDAERDRGMTELFLERMRGFGMEGKVILYTTRDATDGDLPCDFVTMSRAQAESVIDRADLLLNSYYAIAPALLERFARTALLDIDPGLLQFWVSNGQLTLPQHDLYFTTGETVGAPRARFSDCGLRWLHIRPPVCLTRWPYVHDPTCEAMTTVSGWWGGEGEGEWITDGKGVLFENNKRVTFMQFVELPRRTPQVLELALCLGDGDPPAKEQFQRRGQHAWEAKQPCPKDITDYVSDAKDRALLEYYGWRIRPSIDAAGTPGRYQQYIRNSRGEFSCAKPSCMYFQNAWVSDRTICYLASGKPAVVQDTGPSAYLPSGEGMFRFSTMAQAQDAIERINADYARQCRAAREIAEANFDARGILERMLNQALKPARPVCMKQV